MAKISEPTAQKTLEFFEWFVRDGCCSNPSNELLDEQAERAVMLRDEWRDVLGGA